MLNLNQVQKHDCYVAHVVSVRSAQHAVIWPSLFSQGGWISGQNICFYMIMDWNKAILTKQVKLVFFVKHVIKTNKIPKKNLDQTMLNKKIIYNIFREEVASALATCSFQVIYPLVKLESRVLLLCRGMKTWEPTEKPMEQGESEREPQPTHGTWPESNPGHIGRMQVLSTLHHPRKLINKGQIKNPKVRLDK